MAAILGLVFFHVFFISSNDLLVNESDFASYDTTGQLGILSARGGWGLFYDGDQKH